MANQSKRVLVTGKNGQLGQSLKQLTTHYPQLTMTFVGREEFDLASTESIEAYFANNEYDVIINCAAYTAVDKAESEPNLANRINHLAVKQLAKIAKQQDATLIHISTDYVFNGQNHKPYIESDPTDPQSVYGSTKLKGEQAIQGINSKGCIIRTSWVYSEFGNNFVKTMLRLGAERDSLSVIFDQVGTPTYAGDLAKAILQIVNDECLMLNEVTTSIQHQKSNIYHYSNEGVCSWYDLAKTIFEYAKIPCVVLSIETKDYPTHAKRPHYSLMNKAKIKQTFDLAIPYWKDSLQTFIQRLQEQNYHGL
jgi:dTDP-4-dehydrorhamnose reductase